MKKREVVWALLGLICGLGLFTLWLAPRVISWSPAAAQISAGQAITATFNHPIRSESAGQHFSIEPAVEGRLEIKDSTLTFRPLEPLSNGERYTVTLSAGLQGQNGLPSWLPAAIQIRVRPPQLVYLRPIDGRANLWLVDDLGVVRQISDEPFSLWDYSVMPDGSGFLLSTLDEAGTADLAALSIDGQRRLLLDCSNAFCSDPQGQPGGSLVAFEKAVLDEPRREAQVWLLDTDTGQQRPAHDPGLLAAAGIPAAGGLNTLDSRAPRWSADGRYLSYFKPDARLIIVIDTQGGQPTLIPANLEVMGGWSPDGYWLAYTELAFGNTDPHSHVDQEGSTIEHSGTALFSHVVVTDLVSGRSTDLAEGLEVDDSRPAWHPGGQLLAVGRTLTGSGRQVWLLPLDGADPMALTDDPFVQHSALAWSPDGRRLAHMQTGLAGDDEPAVWLMDATGGDIKMVEQPAFQPAWLP